MELIRVKDLSLGYENRPIVTHLNFTVKEGEYLCILGENGSGKTTLMRTLLGLQKPLGGTITIGEGLRSNDIGYLPQQTQAQKDFPASVYEVVLSGCQASASGHFFYTAADRRLVEENLRKMDILELKDRCYRELSGGQQQRVLLARALCAAKKVLLLDEPVSGLDQKVTAEMYEVIRKLNREGITILMISHDVETAVRDASHVLHIGTPLFFGTKQEFLADRVCRLYLMSEQGEQEWNS
ncbi:MAG: ABC transporter ATP-binding protein [Solobacterium sp.]|nr:ABC transporter ATP-binding protein [Solobacterium sp.]